MSGVGAAEILGQGKQGDEMTMTDQGKVGERECVSAGPLQVILVALICTVT